MLTLPLPWIVALGYYYVFEGMGSATVSRQWQTGTWPDCQLNSGQAMFYPESCFSNEAE